MNEKVFVRKLYEIKGFASKTFSTLKETLKEERVWKWIGIGIVAYGLPALYRYITKNPNLPYMPLVDTPYEYIPSNLPEKLIINSIAPGGVGAVIGETFVKNFTKKESKKLRKYLSRVSGSLTTTSVWAAIQYAGYYICDILKYEWPSGGNPFEPPIIYPFNLFIAASLAPFVPYIADFLKFKIKKNSRENEN